VRWWWWVEAGRLVVGDEDGLVLGGLGVFVVLLQEVVPSLGEHEVLEVIESIIIRVIQIHI
jgi:hypothetical protein